MECSDDFFAPRENLLKPEAPVFIPGKFTDRGKWMDGWESRRKREPGHDWCIIRLGVTGRIAGFCIDTSHFTGNYPEACSVDAAACDPGAEGASHSDLRWIAVLPRTPLGPDRVHHFPVAPEAATALGSRPVTHVRLNIYPDGGVARFRVFGEVCPNWTRLERASDGSGARIGLVDLAAAVNGGLVLAASDMHFGSRHNLIMPGRSENMGDGWETRRKRGLTWGSDGPNEFDWCVIRLGRRGVVHRVEVDTNHFKGNYPQSCDLRTCDAESTPPPVEHAAWRTLVPRTVLRADERRELESELVDRSPCTHVCLRIYPDGGVSRLRMWGVPL